MQELCAATIVLLGVASALAQDTRTVTEPHFPKACATLTAQLGAVDGGKTIAEADESKADTARIQKAIDGCAAGQAVEKGEILAVIEAALNPLGSSLAVNDPTSMLSDSPP